MNGKIILSAKREFDSSTSTRSDPKFKPVKTLKEESKGLTPEQIQRKQSKKKGKKKKGKKGVTYKTYDRYGAAVPVWTNPADEDAADEGAGDAVLRAQFVSRYKAAAVWVTA